jgi:acyl dehydratase
MRLICDAYLLEAASLGSPGVNAVRWTQPVRPGDRLKLRMTVLEAKPSRSKPDRGTVLHRWEVFNQRGEPVMTMEGYGMFSRRIG